ncbi:MAG: DUF899 family protein [Solirubrobacteraceae bacterium]
MGHGRFALSELFEDGKDTLVLYSFMFLPGETGPLDNACPACTSIIDALDGQAPHLTQLINLAVAAKVPIEQFREHASTRGWRAIRLLSAANTTYNHDYYTETPEGSQRPIATVFVRREGKIHHFSRGVCRSRPFRHVALARRLSAGRRVRESRQAARSRRLNAFERRFDVAVEQVDVCREREGRKWWPSHRCTWTALRPSANRSVAHGFRKAWKPIRSRPAFSRAGSSTRRRRLPT